MQPREILAQAVDALEHEQNTQRALELDQQAAQEAEQGGDLATAAEAKSHQALVLRRIYRQTDDHQYLDQSVQVARQSVELAKRLSDTGAWMMPLFKAASSYYAAGLAQEAVDAMDEAIQIMHTNPPATHDRPSVLHDMRIHREYFAYQAGDKGAIGRLEQAIDDLRSAGDPDIYALDVWASGGYLKAAEVLVDDDHARGLSNLMKARDIIAANPELVLRRSDWNALAERYGRGDLFA